MKGIYKYTDLKTGDIVYVGKDSHIDKNKRYNAHMAPSRYDDQSFNRVLQKNPNRYKYDVLIKGHFTPNLLIWFEKKYIAKYNPKFNFTKGGDGAPIGNQYAKGKMRSDKTKKKISESKKGKNRSDNTKMNISKAKNTVGYYNVSKKKDKKCKQGFRWRYTYSENFKQKEITSVDIKELEKKVKDRGLIWKKF